MQTAVMSSDMSPEKKKVDLDRNYSDETFYTDSSEDMHSKCKSAATLLQKKQQLRPINGNPYRSTTRLTLTSSSTKNVSLVAQKIMSAKLLRVKQLQNELTDAQFQLNELSTENRILRTLQKRQDMALKKYEGTQAELPQLIRSHNEEVRTLKTKLKQVKSQCRELENNLKMRETELSALQEQHKHLIKLSKSRHLGEREHLQQQLEHMQDLLKENDKKVQMLTRKLMLESKNYKYQLTAEVARHKRTTKELDIALERITQLESVLVAKEKYISVNLARTPHQSMPSLPVGAGARFQLFQIQSQSASERMLSQKHYSNEHVAVDRKDNLGSFGNTGGEVSAPTDKSIHKEETTESSQTRNISEQRSRLLSLRKHHDDEDEENDTDDDYQQFIFSESTDQSYTSQMTASKSTENISKDFKETCKENETKSNTLNRSPREANMQMTYILETEETRESEIKLLKNRNPLRRYSVSGDSELIVNNHISTSSRRGSLNGAGDGGTANYDKCINQKPTTIQNPSESVDSTNSDHIKHISGSDSEVGDVLPNALEIPQSGMTAEECQLHFKVINSTWNELQNRIRDETDRVQSVIEKCDEEQRYADKQIGKKPGMSENYDKNNLLAALRAIEGGADPVDINDDKDKKLHLPICKSKKVEYGNVAQAVENLHRGIPTRASSSVPAFSKPQDGNIFWETDPNITPKLIHTDIDIPKANSELMHEIFGHHK